MIAATTGCSVRKLAVNGLADALAGSQAVWATDEDPELVGAALPFALKTYESLLAESPDNRALLVGACSGFTQYAYAFVEAEAFVIEPDDYGEARRLRERALRLYLRGRDYCFRALDLRSPEAARALEVDPGTALSEMKAADVDLLYWTGASWGAAISLGLDRPDLVVDLPAVRALMGRALALDEDYADGAIREAMIVLDGLPETMGGSPALAREHFERAVELAGGGHAGAFVALAETVSIPAQDAAEFRRLLESALAVDLEAAPAARLANVIAQQRAQLLLERIDDYFFDLGEDES